jgi:hypothetical protein
MAAAKNVQAAKVQDLAWTLAGELRALRERDLAPGETYDAVAAEAELSALCLSGGGVRSAAFSLGVVQALARAGLLARFDYLSTVSGGGFIGAWLSTLIKEHGSAEAAEAIVKQPRAAAVTALRDSFNYLMPDGGLLSEDGWTSALLYLRNVIINWLGFGPIFLTAVLAAICYRTAIWTVASIGSPLPADAILLCGLGVLTYATFKVARDLPGHRPGAEGTAHRRAYTTAPEIRAGIVIPVMTAWCGLMPLAFGRWLAPEADPGLMLHAWLPLAYALAITAGFWIAASRERAWRHYWRNFSAWLGATMASALLLFAGMQLIRAAPGNIVPPKEQAEFLAVFGPLLLTLANIMQATAYVALRREAVLADLDREWLARLSAVKLRLAAVWFCFAFCCLTLPRLAFHSHAATAGDWPAWLVPVATLLSGPVAAWLGKQAMSRVDAAVTTTSGTVHLFHRLLPLLGILFAAGLFSLLALLAGTVLGMLQGGMTLQVGLLLEQVAVAIALMLMVRFAAARINVNRFSMHGVYRNRLTRAFLGAARATRDPDPFTRFDPQDNARLATLLTGAARQKLLAVFNVTLNLTTATRAAWKERKAAAFTMTPLACGAADLPPAGRYVPTALYGGREQERGADDEPRGMTLATAMTISGAAISPNWGYHSSPITAFLMTLFNLRLGAWLPNPAVVTNADEMADAKPRNAFWPMLNDLLGTTSDRSRAVYLSDGGHFDNLGLYEMLRRRCRLILLVDAGEDFECRYADFGTAIRRACIDLQVEVTFNPHMRIAKRGACVEDALDFAMATIVYAPDVRGRILYLKPCLLDDVPPDVRAYAAEHSYFPHQRTLDQAFTESQFESYRHLGEYQASRLTGLLPGGPSGLGALFDAAEGRQARPRHTGEARAAPPFWRYPRQVRARYQPL